MQTQQLSQFQAQGLSLEAYDAYVAQLRRDEFARLGESVYADHAGAALYSERQLGEVFQDLRAGTFGNPHSQHAQLKGTGGSLAAQETARRITLEMCNTTPADYICIFTSGATGGMKLVAEAFPWSSGSMFTYTRDNHTSVLGMRGPAMRAGASAVCVDPYPEADGTWRFETRGEVMRDPASRLQPADPLQNQPTSHLFAFPLESNFNGARYDPGMAGFVQERGCHQNGQGAGQRWWVLLDAAKACSTRPPDLSTCSADFVVLSFYKIFGYPTGLGALLVRKSAAQLLKKPYFGGGTVAACSADSDFVRRREGAAGMEDGTASYLGIAAIPHGFRQLERMGGFLSIERHANSIARRLAERMASLLHSSGAPAFVLYSSWTQNSNNARGQCQRDAMPGIVGWGPTVTFNVLRADGSYFGYREVEKLAGLCGILLRGGCFCNPGACAAHLGLSLTQVQENYEAGHVCWDDNDLIAGQPTGAIRVSFGFSSTAADGLAILAFLANYFVEGYEPPQLKSAALSLSEIQEDPQLQLAPTQQSQHSAPSSSAGTGSASVRSEQGPATACDDAACSAQRDESGDAAAQREDSVTCEASARTSESVEEAEQHPGPSIPPWPWNALRRTVIGWLPILHSRDKRQDLPVPEPLTHPSSPSDISSSLNTSSLQRSVPKEQRKMLQAGMMSSTGGLDDKHASSTAGSLAVPAEGSSGAPVLSGIWVFPIKSCSGCAQQSWPLGPNGLLFDREWALVGEEGEVLTLKKVPQLTAIQPTLDVSAGIMTVEAPNMAKPLVIPLPAEKGQLPLGKDAGADALRQHIRVCAESVCSMQVESLPKEERVSDWFSQALGRRCRLVQQQPGSRQAVQPHQLAGGSRGSGNDNLSTHLPSIGFANEAQMLLISQRSVADLNARLASMQAERAKDSRLAEIDAERFRPNLLISGGQAFEEDAWASISLGGAELQVAGPCARCEVVCVDPRRGVRHGPEPLLTLASFRRVKGRIYFGVLLQHLEVGIGRKKLAVGMPLQVSYKH